MPGFTTGSDGGDGGLGRTDRKKGNGKGGGVQGWGFTGGPHGKGLEGTGRRAGLPHDLAFRGKGLNKCMRKLGATRREEIFHLLC